jgi:VIT1/CCC1 family predicted Fe2+/Mn2+ transporter
MVLTFTGSLSVATAENADVREMLIGAMGCNIAWGIIDAALYIVGELFGRGRLRRLGQMIRGAPTKVEAESLVAGELDEYLSEVTSEPDRKALYARIADNVRSRPPAPNPVTKSDLMGAFWSFWLVFLASLPAAIPFVIFDDARFALRVSNAILLALLFISGYLWARYTVSRPWLVGLCFLVAGIALVLAAIALGG